MQIRSITISRYRGIEQLDWRPNPGLNCLIGPADSGKSTVLAAIGLLLCPRPVSAASDYDYHRRRIHEGFEIQAVIGALDPTLARDQRVLPLSGWLDGQVEDLPDEDGAEPALVVRVTGNADLEVRHEVLPPSGEPKSFGVSLRRALGLMEVGGQERSWHEFRMAQGSLLTRHVDPTELRRALTSGLGEFAESLELPQSVLVSLASVNEQLKLVEAVEEASLSVITPKGHSFLGLLGLHVGEPPSEAIPLAFSGAGTRKWAIFALTTGLVAAAPIVTIDEPESGLEPYRQLALLEALSKLVGDAGQAFFTTHSETVLGTLKPPELWRLAGSPTPQGLPEAAADALARAPQLFVSRVPVLCEGATEQGFLEVLLERDASVAGRGTLAQLGVTLAGQEGGQPKVLDEATALLDAGMALGLFVDSEEEHAGKRKRLDDNERCAFGTWKAVRNVEEAVVRGIRDTDLPRLLEAATHSGMRFAALEQQLTAAMGRNGRETIDDLIGEHGSEAVRAGLETAMLDNAWFKNTRGGRALAALCLEVGVPDSVQDTVGRLWLDLAALLT